MDEKTLSIVLTSAAVSAIVTGIFSFINTILERKSKKKELLMASAINLAESRAKMLIHFAVKRNLPIEISDHTFHAIDYFHLLKKGFENELSEEDIRNCSKYSDMSIKIAKEQI